MGSRLFVVKGTPAEQFPLLFEKWSATCLTFESDIEPYAKIRDRDVCRLAAQKGVQILSFPTHTLHDPEAYLAKLQGKAPPTVYQSFIKLFLSLGPVAPAVPAIDSALLPPLPTPAPPTKDDYSVPTLEELGYPPTHQPILFPGGETEGLARMHAYLAKTQWIASFEKPLTPPNSLEPSTTVLSPYLKHGAVSPRLFYHELNKGRHVSSHPPTFSHPQSFLLPAPLTFSYPFQAFNPPPLLLSYPTLSYPTTHLPHQTVYAQTKKHTQPPVSLVGQLLWREFYYLNGHAVPNFDKMLGNPICKQVGKVPPTHPPTSSTAIHLFHPPTHLPLPTKIPWGKNPELLAAWEEARTGYPFIDACMTQLREEGWIHHLARYVSFPHTHPPTHSFTHPFIHSFIHSFVHPPTHPPTHPPQDTPWPAFSPGATSGKAGKKEPGSLRSTSSTPTGASTQVENPPTHPPTSPPNTKAI